MAATLIPGRCDKYWDANHISISPSHLGQLSLLPSAARKMSARKSAATLCGWGVKADMVHYISREA